MAFKKGQSGNPGGRPTVTVDGVNINELARQRGQKAIETLTKIMESDAAADAARIKACEVLLDRGFGKAIQKNELSGPDGTPLQSLSQADLEARLQDRLKQLGMVKE